MRIFKIILFLTVALCVCSCRSTKDVEKVYVHDTISNTQIVYDSVDRWQTHYEFLSGDTLYRIDTIYYSRWKTKTDTLIDVVHDVELRTEEKIVERVKYVLWPSLVIGFFSFLIFGFLYMRSKHK